MSGARQTLERLLRKGERARLRGDAAPVSLPMTTEASAHDYLALRTLAQIEEFHAAIALAERAGAIIVKRDRHRDDGQRLLRIAVADLAALAAHLGMPLLDQRVAEAESVLAQWRAHFPVLDEVLETWRRDRKVRGNGPKAATALADAARVVAACREDPGRERILRRESVRLFGDSKRLETLTPWLDLLASGKIAAEGLKDKSHVWAALGLRKEPQPFLLAGCGILHLEHGEVLLVRPWLGVPVESLRGLRTSARCVLSVENLASFHDAARLSATGTLLLYTGGMPSPAWRSGYAAILRGMAADARVYHWGDIDEGGFRIAAVLAQDARDAGYRLRPWKMAPASLPGAVSSSADAPAPGVLNAMCRYAERAGWPEVAEDLRRHPMRLEQEVLEPTGPDLDRPE